TDTYALDLNTIRKLSQQEGDSARIIWPNDIGTIDNPVNYTDYDTIPGDRLKDYDIGKYCARRGPNLVFNTTFKTTDPEYGGKLYVPCYTFVEQLTEPEDDIVVDDPDWLILICAAEAARTDI